MTPDTHNKVPTPYSDAEMDRMERIFSAIGELKTEVKTGMSEMQRDIGYIKENVGKSQITCEKQSEKVSAKLTAMQKEIDSLKTFKDRALWAFAILTVLFLSIGVPIILGYIKIVLGI